MKTVGVVMIFFMISLKAKVFFVDRTPLSERYLGKIRPKLCLCAV